MGIGAAARLRGGLLVSKKGSVEVIPIVLSADSSRIIGNIVMEHSDLEVFKRVVLEGRILFAPLLVTTGEKNKIVAFSLEVSPFKIARG